MDFRIRKINNRFADLVVVPPDVENFKRDYEAPIRAQYRDGSTLAHYRTDGEHLPEGTPEYVYKQLGRPRPGGA